MKNIYLLPLGVGLILLGFGCKNSTQTEKTLPTYTNTVVTGTPVTVETPPNFEQLAKSASKDIDGKIVLTGNMRQLFPGKTVCAAEELAKGYEASNRIVKYRDNTGSISFDVPYNDVWSFCGFSLAPVDLTRPVEYGEGPRGHDTLGFGPLRKFPNSGSELRRTYEIQILPTSTVEEDYAALQENKNSQIEVGIIDNYTVEKKTIGQHQVLVKKFPGAGSSYCPYVSYFVYGPEATYVFGAECVDTTVDGVTYKAGVLVKELESTIATIKFRDNEKVILDSDFQEKNQKELCKEIFNYDLPNTKIDYSDKDLGITMKFPYNQKWGNEKYTVPPFSINKTKTKIEFGPIYTGLWEGGYCGAMRTRTILVKEPRTAEAVLAEGKNEQEGGAEKSEQAVLKIGSVTVVKTSDFGMCMDWNYEIIGKKHNYYISQLCGNEEGAKSIEEFIKDVILVD